MKKIISLLIAVLMILSLVSCDSDKKENNETKRLGYVISDEVKEGSIVDGVMTDIGNDDPILQKSVAEWLDTCVLYEVNVRQYTEEGTFAAFEKHLDRLKEMGINTLWFMPIHPISEKERKGTLGSYYAVSDYKAVNPEFGTIDDFTHLVDKAHDMGFKVILDWVANHTGWDNPWLEEHPDWYVRDDNGKVNSPFNWTDVAELNFDNFEMRAEMIDCMRYWVEDIGVDGFRCDHAIGVPTSFWNAAVYKLKSINSEILMLAEMSASSSMTQYAFDSCYNDPLYSRAPYVKGVNSTEDIKKAIEVGSNYEKGSFPMNFLDNHDKNSYEGSVVYRYGDTYPMLLALTYVAPGMPLIYTSDEEGYDHEIEFFEKDTVEWDSEPKYAPLITALSALKAGNKALASTNTDLSFYETDSNSLLAFSRTSGENKVIFISNMFKNNIEKAGLKLDFDKAVCVLHDDGSTLDTAEKEVTAADFENISLKPYEYFILVVNG